MINFMKYKWIYLLISSAVIVPGLISLLVFGLKPSIDFTGGSRWELSFEKDVKVEDLRGVLNEEKVEVSSVVTTGAKRYLIKMKFIDEKERVALKEKVEKNFGKVTELRFETIGPVLGRELLAKTATALVLAALLILAYIAWQFKNWSFGISATIATLHDSLVILGSFSLLGRFFGFEVDTLFVTALLTILSFSVHDTIVVYDRIRESLKRFPGTPFETLVNKAISETLVRSLNNSITVIFMLISLVVLGGDTIRQFAIALLIGTVSGTYSSIFTAAPILAVWKNRLKK